MRNFFLKLLSENTFKQTINLYSWWHIFYLLFIFGSTLAFYFIFRKRSQRTKTIVVNIFAYLTIGMYVIDFFLMPLSDSYGFRISADKLPFHICTLMAIFVPFAQFNKKFKPIKPVIVMMSLVSSIMWMVYPGSALGGSPAFCYQVYQTFMYHGILFGYGVLSIALDGTKLNIKKCWMDLVAILIIFVWAWFGNTVYADYNWFFIKTSIFPFIPDKIMPPVVIVAVFAVCMSIYGLYYLILYINKKIQLKKKPNTIEQDTPTTAEQK